MNRLVLVLAAVFSSFTLDAWSQKIHVVTRNIEPFSFEQNGRRVGYAMELWQEVAREAGIDYDVKVVGTAQEMVDALTNRTADAAVGALSVTSKREEIMDFSQPFYESGLQILTSGKTASIADTIFQLVGNLLNWKLVGAFTLLIVVMLVISHLVWLYEHKVNEEMWPKSYRHGLWESFWWTISTLLFGGADNKGPVGVGGRIIAIIWMLLSIVLVSLLTASFTTTLTVNTLKGDISGPGDLPGRDVATITGSTAANWLSNHGANPKPYSTLAECITALKRKEVAAVVYDAPLVQYAVSKDGDDKLQLVEPVFDRQNYAIGLQQDSPLRERINRALLSLAETGANTDLQKKWFGSASE